MANANLRFACRQTDERRQKTFEFRLAFPSGILAVICVGRKTNRSKK